MFTGIIEEVGRVTEFTRGTHSCVLGIEAASVLGDTRIGDSIAVNGVCLTLTGIDAKTFTADVMNETCRRSSFGTLRVGDPVNLERAVMVGGRLGGHIVSGHIDGIAHITDRRDDGNAVRFTFTTDREILSRIVERGSVALDGISLTVTHVGDRDFGVSLIPHTLTSTNFAGKRKGDVVNVENDVIGKYVARLLGCGIGDVYKDVCEDADVQPDRKITETFLRENGF